ncbi:MAG: protein kinase [Limnothrix sp.]
MVYCLNPQCSNPFNPNAGNFCVHCGRKLRLSHRYEGVKLIQQGMKGRTILGIDQGSSPPSYCIIKQATITSSVIPKEFLASFRRNAQQLDKLGDHREFPTVLEALIPESLQDPADLPTVIFEKIEGESLLQRFNSSGRFTEEKIRDFLCQILPLLQTISDHQIVHRDLSPGNIIYTPDQYWAIVDFSAAKVTSKMAHVQQGTLVGSGIYTAPEQLRGKSYPASDLYSLGIICLELLTMMHPFELYSSHEGIWIWQDYLKVPVSSELADLLNQMVAEKVGDRPRNANAVLKALGVKTKSNPVAPTVSPNPTSQAIPEAPEIEVKPEIPKSPEKWYCLKTFKGHRGYISDLKFDKSGTFLASAAADQTIRIWNTEYRFEIKCLRGHQGIVSSLVFVGNQLISGSWDYTIRFWNWRAGKESDRLEQNQSWISSLVTVEDDQKLAVLSADKQINLWDLSTKKRLANWHSQGSSLIHSDKNSPVLVSANDHDVLLWQQDKIL